MLGILNNKMVSVDTRSVDGTFAIGVSFICIAYFLHPLVESAYHRVRAYRAWRALEKRETVEVTNYSMLAETLGGRGKWDTARIITVLLAVFSLVSWGLELSMGLAYQEGEVDVLNRSPVITIKTVSGEEVWEIKPEEDFPKNWKKTFNMDDNRALSLYNVEDSKTCRSGRVTGNIRVAFWSENVEDTPAPLYYNESPAPTVETLQCAGKDEEIDIVVGESTDPWGTVQTCDSGPKLNLTETDNDASAPPMLILRKRFTNDIYIIVEESSNYPSFLYSVWSNQTQNNNDNQKNDSMELKHEFHIAATMRLAGAVVTTIVHGKLSGLDCFKLVRLYSYNFSQAESENHNDTKITRAKPFGEDPKNDPVQIGDLETLECGLEIGLAALICSVFLALLTVFGITWSFLLRSSIGMDVYDRDELIRAVSMSAAPTSRTAPSAIRIFVRKEDSGSLSVVISDTGYANTGCRKLIKRRRPVVEDIESAPTAAQVTQFNNGYGGAAVPAGRPTMWLEGVRTGMGKSFPGPNGNFRYPTSVSLCASPVPSPAFSLVATPAHGRSPPPRVPRDDQGLTRRRGASIFFDESGFLSDSEEDVPGGTQAGDKHNGESGGALNARVVAPGYQKSASGGALSARVVAPDYQKSASGGALSARVVAPDYEKTASGGAPSARVVAPGYRKSASGGALSARAVAPDYEKTASGGAPSARVVAPDYEKTASGGAPSARVVTPDYKKTASGGALSARVVVPGYRRGASGILEDVHPPDMKRVSLSDRRAGATDMSPRRTNPSGVARPSSPDHRVKTNVLRFSSKRMTHPANGGLSSGPPLLRHATLGPSHLGPLSGEVGDEAKE